MVPATVFVVLFGSLVLMLSGGGAYGDSLVLDTIPGRAAYGDALIFSGTLSLDARSPEGSIVYIKDKDSTGPDDLLASAYVDHTGRFTTTWIVEDVDSNHIIDIQAVYEANSSHDRMATPVQHVRTYNDSATLPQPEPASNDGYMELYRSLDFEQTPRIAIVPAPDSYNEVQEHIVPVQEGILGLNAVLEQVYPAGDWDVDFEVVNAGFNARPDIIMNLVTRDDHSKCDWDRYGGSGTFVWAHTNDTEPVTAVVCLQDDETNDQIGAAAAHEFAHAMGLGHTFNISGDRMCGVENGTATCPDLSKSASFSTLNLAALMAIYGTDGYTNPNNDIAYKEKFRLGNRQAEADPPPPTDQDGIVYTDLRQYRVGEVILVDAISLDAYEGKILKLALVDQDQNTISWTHVTVEDAMFAEFFYATDFGTQQMLLHSGDDLVAASTLFEVDGFTDAEIYTEYIYYDPGDLILIDGSYWRPYDGLSRIVVHDHSWNIVYQTHTDVTDGFFSAQTSGHQLPGRYEISLYDEEGNYMANTAIIIR